MLVIKLFDTVKVDEIGGFVHTTIWGVYKFWSPNVRDIYWEVDCMSVMMGDENMIFEKLLYCMLMKVEGEKHISPLYKL